MDVRRLREIGRELEPGLQQLGFGNIGVICLTNRNLFAQRLVWFKQMGEKAEIPVFFHKVRHFYYKHKGLIDEAQRITHGIVDKDWIEDMMQSALTTSAFKLAKEPPDEV